MNRYTPPMWLRHVTPWWLLRLIERRFNACGVGVAQWKYGHQERGYETWWPTWSCMGGPPHAWDYCGRYKNAAEFEAATGIELPKETT
jgi:hypothetical protein